jgi:hypothetical protein
MLLRSATRRCLKDLPGRWRKSKLAWRILAEPIKPISRAKGPPGARLFLRNCVPAANPGWSDDRGTRGSAKASSPLALS